VIRNYFFVLLSSLFFVVPILSQDADEINNKAAGYLLALAQEKNITKKEFIELKDLFTNVDTDLLETKYHSHNSAFDSLRSHLQKYEKDKIGIDADSSLVLFVDWYLHFQRTFYNYNRKNFFNSSKAKILFFTTSVSCRCTMEMCRKQLIEILNLKKMSGDAYSFLVVDSYWNNDLQLKYESYFAPSVLIFNGSNEILSLIEYDEKMSEKLNESLKKM